MKLEVNVRFQFTAMQNVLKKSFQQPEKCGKMCVSRMRRNESKKRLHVSGENCAVEETFITAGDGKPNGMEATDMKIVCKSLRLLFMKP